MRVRRLYHLTCGALMGWTSSETVPTYNGRGWHCCMCRRELFDGHVSFYARPSYLYKFDSIGEMVDHHYDLAIAEVRQMAEQARGRVEQILRGLV